MLRFASMLLSFTPIFKFGRRDQNLSSCVSVQVSSYQLGFDGPMALHPIALQGFGWLGPLRKVRGEK